MIDDEHAFMGILRLGPGRLTVEQTAWLLGFTPSTIGIIVKARIGLKPIGKSTAANTPMAFSFSEVERLRLNTKFLSEATSVVRGAYYQKRKRRNGNGPNGEDAMS